MTNPLYKIYFGDTPYPGEHNAKETVSTVSNIMHCISDRIEIIRVQPEPMLIVIDGGRKPL